MRLDGSRSQRGAEQRRNKDQMNNIPVIACATKKNKGSSRTWIHVEKEDATGDRVVREGPLGR